MVDIESNKSEIISLLTSTGREGMDILINKLNESDYFIAPAAIKHHMNVPGGLAQHSLNVYHTFSTLCDSFGIDVPLESRIIAGLLHDICKVGQYVPVDYGYRRNEKHPRGHGDLSVRRLEQTISLTKSEALMIRWHMNKYDANFYSQEEALKVAYPEVYAIYFADHISSLFLEG